MSQVNARQDDFAIATLHQAAYFRHNFIGRPAAQNRPNLGNDAEGAVQQAAVLHLDESTAMTVETRNARYRAPDAEWAELVYQQGFVGDDLMHARQLADS